MSTSNTFYSWSTRKTDNGFTAIVTKNVSLDEPNEKGSYVNSEIIQQINRPTRARAKSIAQKWVKYYKATA